MPRSQSHLEIVFLLAGAASRRAELHPRARACLARADYPRLERELADRRLLPLIGSRAIDAAPDLVPGGFRAAVERARNVTRLHNLAVEGATRRAAALLERAGIRALALKGPLLAADVHGDTGLRGTHDVDLLVARADLDVALEQLQAAGYAPQGDAIRPDGMPDLHYTLRHPNTPPLELHWRVHWDEQAFSERLLARAVPGDDGLLRALPDDQAAALLLFYARDGLHGVRIAADIAAWWDRHGAAMPRRFLEELASDHPQLAPSLTAAAVAVERLCGVPATEWLGSSAATGRRVSLATRLADWMQDRDRDQMAANMSLAAGLLGPPGSASRFARRELSIAGARPTANAVHAAKLFARYAIALWVVRGGRNWADPPCSAGAR